MLMTLGHIIVIVIVIVPRFPFVERNRNLPTSKAPLKNQAQASAEQRC